MAKFEDVLAALRTGSRVKRAVWTGQRYWQLKPAADGRLALIEGSANVEWGKDGVPIPDLLAADWELVDGGI